MIPDKYIELIHREIDGLNSPKQSAKLKTFLAANVEAQKLYDELTTMSAMMKEAKVVEPPSHLQHVIMNALPPHRYPAKKAGILAQAMDFVESKINFKYAYAFSGGLALGVAMYALVFQAALKAPDDSSELSGAMMRREPVEKLKTAHSFEINRDGVTGKIDLKIATDIVAAELALESTQPVELTIIFDEQHLSFKSLTVLDESTSVEAILIPGAAQLTHVGRKSYALVLAKKDETASQLEFKIVRAGELLFERAVQAAW